MKNSEYWKKRAEAIANKEFKKVDDYTLRLYLEYQEALNSVRKDIEVFYARFAQNNKISLLEARKLLNSNELNEFKMSLEEFRHKAKNNSNFEWEKELNNVSYKVRITRLQALQTQIKNSIEGLYIKQQEGTTNILGDIYKDTYYRNIYELHKGLGIGVNFAKLDNNMVNKVLNENWQTSNYSSRIWSNKEKLIMELQTNLTQAFIRGDSIDKTSKIIANRMEVASNRARTLVNTESAYITQKATFDSYSKSGVIKEYEILATLDLHTSEICRSLDGKIFKLSEKEIGVTAPPFHPNCRTTTVAYFPDTVDEERIVRDSEGNIYYVDGNMKYEDWHNKYVKGNSKEEIREKKIKNKYSDKKQFEEYKKILGNEAPKSFDKFQELKYNKINEWELFKDYSKSRSTNMISAFSSFEDYNKYKNIIQNEIVGLNTSNGIKITGQSKHFIERVFGTTKDPKTNKPRSGVEINHIKDAILNGDVRSRKNDPDSLKFITDKCIVSINPNTGNLIQTNPQ